VEEPEVINKVIDDAAAIGVDLTPTFVFIATWINSAMYDGDSLMVSITFLCW
jgi:hypothetical protein